MVHVTVFRLRVGSFGSTSVTCSAEKIYSGGGASDRITELIRDLPRHGSAIETAAADLGINIKRWKEHHSIILQCGSCDVDGNTLGQIAQSICADLADIQTHGTKMVCVTKATGSKTATEQVTALFVEKIQQVDIPEKDFEDY